MSELVDPFSRRLSYLRLSITDLCNFRCTYCLPNGYQGKAKPNELTLPEIETLVKAFSACGTRKIRITGGEPTLRKDLPEIIAICKEHVDMVALTTNGFRLAEKFPAYRAAGLDKLNLSVDSFDPETFKAITGKNECTRILSALDTLIAEGFTAVKINTLLLKEGFATALSDALNYLKDYPISLRFIELMQTGDNFDFFMKQHVPATRIEEEIQAGGWVLKPRDEYAGPAREYSHPDYAGSLGFIAPYSKDFCTRCNRLRVNSQGNLHLCLFGGIAYSIRDYLQAADVQGLQDYLHEIIQEKPEHHFLHEKKVGLIRDLSMIGG